MLQIEKALGGNQKYKKDMNKNCINKYFQGHRNTNGPRNMLRQHANANGNRATVKISQEWNIGLQVLRWI